MVSTIRPKQQIFDELDIRLPHQKRALILLESEIIKERMKGYALLTTCFQICSSDIRDYIREKWKNEKDLKNIGREFIQYCKEKFQC